jgi:hypothetical protein
MNNSLRCLAVAICVFLASRGAAQIARLIANINARQITYLDGSWQAIVDPYEPLKNNYAF